MWETRPGRGSYRQLPVAEGLCSIHAGDHRQHPPAVAYRPGIGFCNLVPQKFNPSNPNLTFARNYNTGAIIIAAFGTIQ